MTQLREPDIPALDEEGAIVREDAAPFELLEGAVDRGLVLVCDHASNHLPEKYGSLGLSKAEFERHIAYDIGAADVTRRMSKILGVPAVLSKFSRLLIDPNRGPDDPTLIMQLSDGAIIPGNAHINDDERQRRHEQFYKRYHQAIDRQIDNCIDAGRPSAIVSIHSFTQEWRGDLRPWEAGVLWDKDDRLVHPLLDCLRRETDFTIGDNEPYTGKTKGDCMNRHGTSRGLAHALIEIRQDQIKDTAGQQEWGGRLADILTRILADPQRAHELSIIKK
ncbi:MAG: N-formylglutamate amidohydrolase [bacterium]|nr:N-formylglutamate amidohydrolase [bacterium]